MLDKNCIRNFFRLIGYPIGPSSNLYEDNQATIKIVLVYSITPQYRPLNLLITTLREICLCKTFDMVDTRSNMQLADINSMPHGEKILIDIIDRSIVVLLYPPLGSEHYKLLRLKRFRLYNHHQTPSHDKHNKNYQRRV